MVLVVMPGYEIVWEMQVSSQSRLRYVWAVFDDESENPVRWRLVLGGEVYHFEKAGDRRTNYAELIFSKERSDRLDAGRYRLASMNVVTSTGTSRDIPADKLPEVIIRVENEPAEEMIELGDSRLRVR